MTDALDEQIPLTTAAGNSAATVYCVPLPEWVEHRPYSIPDAPVDAYTDNGVFRILYDSQTNVEEAGYSQHFHTIQRIVTRAGAERAAHFAVEFDPMFQRADVHFIRVERLAAQFNHAKSDAFQLLRREKKLEQLALDGRLTATLLIPDLRIDDVLHISLTVTTNNPILERKYASTFAFNALAPWLETCLRLRTPVHRQVFQKQFREPPESVVTRSHEAVDSVWSLTNQTRLEAEELTPPWQIQIPAIQFSEYQSWNQVAQLFAGYYSPSEMPADLTIEVDRIARTFSAPADRAAEWLRFVQRQLRYFALSLGEGGLVPRDLDTIWTRRFGDCKDCTRLFVAGAHRLGIDACAALTSTTHGRALDEFIPSPAVFNHCIVRVRLDGQTYWLDPTMPRQEGALAAIFQPHSGWALPLTADTKSLEQLNADEPIVYRQTEEVFRLGPKPDSPTQLSVRVNYYSFAADAIRHRLENEGHSKLGEQIINELRGTWPDLTQTTPMQIDDDLEANHLVAIFHYEIRNGWKPIPGKKRVGFKVTAGSIATELNPLKNVQRRADVYLGRPRKATWEARLLMPQQWSGNGWNHVSNAAGIHYSNKFIVARSVVHLQREMSISQWSLPASEAGSYQDLVAKASENLVTLFGRIAFGRVRPAAGGLLNLLSLNRNPLRKIWLLLWSLYVLWFIFNSILDKN